MTSGYFEVNICLESEASRDVTPWKTRDARAWVSNSGVGRQGRGVGGKRPPIATSGPPYATRVKDAVGIGGVGVKAGVL